MEPMTIGYIGVAILLILLALGVHIGVSLGMAGFIGYAMLTSFDLSAWRATVTVYFQIAKFTFMTLPLFVFMGLIAARGGIARDLYKGMGMWLGGRMRAGLGIATVLGCTAFGTISGSSLVTAAVFAKVSAPEMRRYGYDKKIAYGVCASAGAIGMLIPPSILMVVYGILTEESIGRLLIAGIAPGLMLAVAFSTGLWGMSRWKPHMFGTPPVQAISCRERVASLKLFIPVFIIGGIVIGGMYSGIFNPNEAAAIASVVVLFYVLITVRGKERWPTVGNGIAETVATSGMIFFILGSALFFGRMLARSGITQAVLNGLVNLGVSNTEFVIILAFVFLIMGCFLDSISMLCITLPIIYPAVKALGIDTTWFAVVQIMAIEAGLITPPVGMNVYGTKAVAEADVPIEDIFIGAAPFFAMFIIVVALLIAFPAIANTLPNFMIK